MYVSTLGKKHYAINEMAKETYLTKVGRTTMAAKDMVPKAPAMRTTTCNFMMAASTIDGSQEGGQTIGGTDFDFKRTRLDD